MIKKQRSSDQQIQPLVVTTLFDTATRITVIVCDVVWSRFYPFGTGTSYVPTATPGWARRFRGAMPWHLTLSGQVN